MNKLHILLFGGSGTLSFTVLNSILRNKEAEVWIFNRGNNNAAIPLSVHILIGNFYDTSSIQQAIGELEFDVVIDFLSRTPEDIARIYPLFIDRCTQYIFISTACVFKRERFDFPIIEKSSKPNTKWKYSVQKYECEKLLKRISEGHKPYFTIIRPYITYDDKRIPYGIAPEYKYHRTIIERIKSGKPMFVWNNGENITTLTSVADFAPAVVGLLLNPKAVNEDFNIVSNFTYKWKDVLNILYSRLGCKPFIVNVPLEDIYRQMPDMKEMLEGDRALDAVFDNTKIKCAVPNLAFTTSLEQGIDCIIKHYSKDTAKLYDYTFDARIDKLISTVNPTADIGYKKYEGAKLLSSLFTYMIYRYLHFTFASRIYNHIRHSHRIL